MKLGLFTMPCHPPSRRHSETYDEDLDMLILADQLGYEEAWIGEHTATTWENIAVPELLIAQALERTKDIKLGTGVTCLPNHNPAQLRGPHRPDRHHGQRPLPVGHRRGRDRRVTESCTRWISPVRIARSPATGWMQC